MRSRVVTRAGRPITAAACLLALGGIGPGCATTGEGAGPIQVAGAEMTAAAAAGPAPTVTSSPAGLASGPRLEQGRALFSARCQSCHALPEPGRLSPEAWPQEVKGMSRKSGLSAEQTTLVAEYLTVASREARRR